MESKEIEKTIKASNRKKATTAFIIKELPNSVHRKILKHQLSLTGKPRIDDAAISLMIAGFDKFHKSETENIR